MHKSKASGPLVHGSNSFPVKNGDPSRTQDLKALRHIATLFFFFGHYEKIS